jgi:hypothetical protein
MAIELGGSVFEITHDLVGDLFRAKKTRALHDLSRRSNLLFFVANIVTH